MKVYVDLDTFECHTTNPDGKYLEYDTPALDGKCVEFIEGCICVPRGYKLTRSDGEVFTGEMVTPFKDSKEMDDAQSQYEHEKLSDAENALAILLGGDVT